MDLCSKKAVKFWLKKYGVQPSKRLGQNFLIDKTVLKKIIEAAELKPIDTVLEIGPGIGTLTQALAEKAGKVIAVEKDPKMTEILKNTLTGFKNAEIINKDIFQVSPYILHFSPYAYKIVANLPYYIVSPVIRKFLEGDYPPQEMILMVQKEVGQRICAKPPRMNLLAISVQFYAEPKIVSFVSKKSFLPAPKVDSAIIKIENIISATHPRKESAFNQRFFRIVKAGFSQPRKQLANNLSNGLKLNKDKVRNWLIKNNIQPSRRAETLSVNDWINLIKSFN